MTDSDSWPLSKDEVDASLEEIADMQDLLEDIADAYRNRDTDAIIAFGYDLLLKAGQLIRPVVFGAPLIPETSPPELVLAH